jgi:hypothetical protein
MAHLRLIREREEIVIDFVAGQRGHAHRRDELLAGLGEDAARGDAALFQGADQLQRLKGGHAAADDEKDAMIGHGRGAPD